MIQENNLPICPAKSNTGGEYADGIIDKIRENPVIREIKTGNLTGTYGYDIYYNWTNYELSYAIEYPEDRVIVVIMSTTPENFYDQLKHYMKTCR